MKFGHGLAVLMACSMVSLAAAQEKKAERSEPEKAAIAEIRKAGGLVLELAQTDPRLDIAFHLSGTEIKDENLVPLKALPSTANLNLRGTKITDAGLANLADLKGLVRLHLEKTGITDAGLAHLANLESLEYLNLYGTPVTDAGLKHLENLKKLKSVYLWETQVTDAGVAALKEKLPEVRVIRGLDLAKPAEPKPEEPKPEEKKE
jgi:hypothetical protein